MDFLISIHRTERTLKQVLCTHYPSFILGLQDQKNDIPAFVYHEVDAESLTADLTFLHKNGYRAIKIDDFVNGHDNGLNERNILLTFDDARRNFWEVAFPVLHKFNVHATLFVPTYWLGDRKYTRGDYEKSPIGRDAFMTWHQVRACVNSGLVDVQPHGHRHALVYNSSRLVAFASPHVLAEDIFQWPIRQNGEREILGRPPLGTPIYEAKPLLSAKSRLIENVSIVRACQELVAAEGEEKFFDRRDWRTRLWNLHQDMAQGLTHQNWMNDNEFLSLVSSEFTLSRQLFEIELGVPPRYFAYPWMLGSERSLQFAAEAGIKAVFGVGLDFGRARAIKGPVKAFYRIKGDWLRFLPGKGRLSLYRVIPEKLKEFLRSQHLVY